MVEWKILIKTLLKDKIGPHMLCNKNILSNFDKFGTPGPKKRLVFKYIIFAPANKT